MNTTISEKEFAVISELSNNHMPNQRIIARRLGISLGLTNLIIKRLVKTGYVKIKQLNTRKIQYLLTPKGFSEKAEKSYKYTLKTVKVLTLIRERIQKLIIEKHAKGIRNIVIVGDNELADLSEIILRRVAIPDLKYARIREIKDKKLVDNSTFILRTSGNRKIDNEIDNKNSVNLILHLSNEGLYI